MRHHPTVLVELSPPVYADAVAHMLRSGGYLPVFDHTESTRLDAVITDGDFRPGMAPLVLCVHDTGRVTVFEAGEIGVASAGDLNQVLEILDVFLRPSRQRRRARRSSATVNRSK